jgi:hypothetical protein
MDPIDIYEGTWLLGVPQGNFKTAGPQTYVDAGVPGIKDFAFLRITLAFIQTYFEIGLP